MENYFKSKKEYIDVMCMEELVHDMIAYISSEFRTLVKRYVAYDYRLSAILPPEKDYDKIASMLGFVPNVYPLEYYSLELYTQLVYIVWGHVTVVKEKIEELDISRNATNNWKSVLPNNIYELHALVHRLYSMPDFNRFSIGVSKTIISAKYPVHDVVELGWNDLGLLEREFNVMHMMMDMV